MVKLVSSLYAICLYKVSEILVKVQRKVSTSTSDNPFRAFPPTVLNDLIPIVCERVEKEERLRSSYLQLLLISGRVTYLKLTDVKILFKDAEEIFNYIQPYSEKLRSIKIVHRFCSNCQESPMISPNFGTLLHSAKNLLVLETSINFNLSELSSCINLKKLIIRFRITHPLTFLTVGDEIRYNHCLKVLKIENIQNFPDLYLDIAEILQYCVEIVEIDYDVSRSLMYLHESQKGTKYKLQTTLLGGCKDSFPLTLPAVQIASLHCPDLRKIVASPADYFATEALSNFRQITDLTLYVPHFPYDSFDEGVRLLLENSHFGHNLMCLTLYDFSEVDFSCIGACCPNLKELRVEYVSEYNSAFTTNSFQNLISLYLENVTEEPCEEDSIIGILSRATSLEFLTIKNATLLNDISLEDILENSKALSSLKSINLHKCGLTIPGLKKFVQSMVSIQVIVYSSSILSFEDIEIVLKASDMTRFT